ncbi:MAG: DUF1150 family protein [Pseudomonadota bacterium]
MTDVPSYSPKDTHPIVYVRAVKRGDLPQDMRDRIEGLENLYAVSSAEGEVLALVDDRAKAFVLARMNDFQPVSVH